MLATHGTITKIPQSLHVNLLKISKMILYNEKTKTCVLCGEEEENTKKKNNSVWLSTRPPINIRKLTVFRCQDDGNKPVNPYWEWKYTHQKEKRE